VTTFTQIFGGTTIWPSDVSLLNLALTANVTLEWPLEAATGANIIARIVEITPTGAYTITMPDATQTGVGQTILFNNLGPDDVTVVKDGGGALLSLAQGEIWQVYLTDNSTAAGTWSSFKYGATTAQAQAAALEGPGIVAIGSVLAQEMDVSTINTTPYTTLTSDRSATFVWIGALGTITLPAAATAGQGWFINLRNGGTGDWTIDPSSSETINDSTTLVLQPGDSAVVATDGLEWWTIGLGKQAVFAFDYTAVDLTAATGNYVLSGAELNRIAYNFTGALAGNTTVVAPPTVQQYWVTNSATGFTLSLSVAGSASPLNIASGEKGIYYSNGTDMVLANTVAGIPTPIAIADGGTGATSATNARSNLSAAKSGANSDITSLTALGAGTASAPTLAPSGDSNTGFYYPAANQLAGSCGGSRSFWIEQAGGAGTGNTMVGFEAGPSLTTGSYAAVFGDRSLRVATGIQNTAFGCDVGFALSTGTRNTLVGYASGTSLTTGGNNTVIGAGASTSSATVSNTVTLGDSGIATLRCQVTTITALSDERDKTNIRPLPMGMDLEFISTLRPVVFDWNARDGSKVGAPDIGFIAQDLLAAMEQCGIEVPHLVDQDNPDKLEVGAGVLLPIAIRAIQQLSDALDSTNARLHALEEGFGR
jgi:hypothetical protein